MRPPMHAPSPRRPAAALAGTLAAPSSACAATRAARPSCGTGAMVEHRIDWERASRTGASEAVLCERKSPAQIDAIVAHALELSRRLLFTRLAEEKFERLSASSRGALDFEPVSRTAILGGLEGPAREARVAISAGGTSASPVAREAARTLAFEGEGT